MKVDVKSEIRSTQLEVITVTIELNPQDEREEGYASLIVGMLDTIKRVTVLEKAVGE